MATMDSVVFFTLISALGVYVFYEKRKLDNFIDSKEKFLNSQPKQDDFLKPKETDFLGAKKALRDPEKFLREVDEIERKMERGEAVKVDAAKALYLIRNAKYHKMVLGEDGTINMKKLEEQQEKLQKIAAQILEDRSCSYPSPANESTKPYYVETIEKFGDGMVRWIYTEEHFKEHGVKSLCFDKFGRPAGDPRKIEAEKNNKAQKQQNNPSNQLENIARQLSKSIDLQKELLYKTYIADENENSDKTNGNGSNSHEIAKNDVEVGVGKNALKFAVDDFVLDNIPVPIFESATENKKSDKTNGNGSNSHEIEKNDVEELVYENLEEFVAYGVNEDVANLILYQFFKSEFASKKTYIDPVDEVIFVEYRSLVNAIKTMLPLEKRGQFAEELAVATVNKSDYYEYYDLHLCNSIFLAISSKTDNTFKFFKHESGEMRTITPLILEVFETEGLFMKGAFLQIDVRRNDYAYDFYTNNKHLPKARLRAHEPKAVKRLAKVLGSSLKYC